MRYAIFLTSCLLVIRPEFQSPAIMLPSWPSHLAAIIWSISMRFTPGFLPWSATACVLTFLSLATPVALSQDAAKSKPKPHVSYEGPALTFDFPGVKIGVAEYEEGPTGTTVLYFHTPVVAAVDVRGGAPGTLNTEGLRLAYDDPSAGSMRSCSREARPTPVSRHRSRQCPQRHDQRLRQF
jgi:hypothetical protein